MKSSIHFCPVKSTSQSHNLRLRDFDYVRKDLKDLNFSFSENQDFQKHSEIIKELKNIVKEKTGRTAQEKAVFIKEGVFLIKPEHTNEQLQKVAQEFAQKFKVKLIELHVHRDEGHWDDKKSKTDWKSNLHAHIVIENINRNTGKSIGWQRNEMILIQDFFQNAWKWKEAKNQQKHTLTLLLLNLKK
jgi:6-phosphofructokinase